MNTPDVHRCELVDDFLRRNLHAECSCGWTGPPARDQDEARTQHAEHVAEEPK